MSSPGPAAPRTSLPPDPSGRAPGVPAPHRPGLPPHPAGEPRPEDLPAAAAAATEEALRGGARGLPALVALARRLLGEVAKFGVVGVVALVTDLGLFNLLRFGVPGGGGVGPIHGHPLTARALSVVVATCVSYAGNRWWTWRDRERSGLTREYLLFFGINLVGLLINLGVLGFVEYVLDRNGPVASNAANLVGIVIGTLVRFLAYRTWVFRPVAAEGERD